MNLPYTKKEILETITIDGKNVVEQGDLMSIFFLLDSGKLTRKMAWQIVRMIHCDELKCPLAIYGTLQTFSLAKDIKEFKRLYKQGCQLLEDENIIDESDLEGEDFQQEVSDIVDQITSALKSGKFTIKMNENSKIIKNKKKEKKDDNFKFPNSDRFKDLN
jgi:hypothetical protein